MSNITLARTLISVLVTQGVNDFLVCAGARNAPLVKCLFATEGLAIKSFFDERSAGFFAVGLIKKVARPVVVVTTSGTAVAELFPAVVEAYYQELPLVVLSADRPSAYRGSGAPQSIEQPQLFGIYTKECFDIQAVSDCADIVLKRQPLHLNVCFDEPLLDEPVAACIAELRDFHCPEKPITEAEVHSQLDAFFAASRSPALLLGPLSNSEADAIEPLLQSWQGPVYLEAVSQLKGKLSGLTQAEFIALFKHRQVDGLIRVGGIPTLRLWRDLEISYKTLPVLSFSSIRFSGLSRVSEPALPLTSGLDLVHARYRKNIRAPVSRQQAQSVDLLFSQYPRSEPALIHRVSHWIGDRDLIFLGNSLPIRYWDEFACIKQQTFACQRGANGIDGIVSHFLGVAGPQASWLIIGDLTALYDLSALAATALSATRLLRIVVINNSGGQIFHRMFQDNHFINPHSFDFAGWADQFRWQYLCLSSCPAQLNLTAEPHIIEIKPDQFETDQFWQDYEST